MSGEKRCLSVCWWGRDASCWEHLSSGIVVRKLNRLNLALLFISWHWNAGSLKFVTCRHFLQYTWKKWPEIWHGHVSWPPSELVRLWSRSVDLRNFGTILTKWKGLNFWFSGIFYKMHWRNDLQFGMLICADHLQNNFLYYSHGLLIFPILAQFWVKFVVCGYFLQNAKKRWPEIWHAYVSWPPSELFRLWKWSVDFPFLCNFGLVKCVKFLEISLEHIEE